MAQITITLQHLVDLIEESDTDICNQYSLIKTSLLKTNPSSMNINYYYEFVLKSLNESGITKYYIIDYTFPFAIQDDQWYDEFHGGDWTERNLYLILNEAELIMEPAYKKINNITKKS